MQGVTIMQENSLLGNTTKIAWLARFSIFDWVGGRASTVGFLSTAVQVSDLSIVI